MVLGSSKIDIKICHGFSNVLQSAPQILGDERISTFGRATNVIYGWTNSFSDHVVDTPRRSPNLLDHLPKLGSFRSLGNEHSTFFQTLCNGRKRGYTAA